MTGFSVRSLRAIDCENSEKTHKSETVTWKTISLLNILDVLWPVDHRHCAGAEKGEPEGLDGRLQRHLMEAFELSCGSKFDDLERMAGDRQRTWRHIYSFGMGSGEGETIRIHDCENNDADDDRGDRVTGQRQDRLEPGDDEAAVTSVSSHGNLHDDDSRASARWRVFRVVLVLRTLGKTHTPTSVE